MERFTFKDFDRMFPDDAACLEWLRGYLYPEGIFCKKCERVTKHHRTVSRPSYSCDYCGHHVHPTAGTIFHKSSTSLPDVVPCNLPDGVHYVRHLRESRSNAKPASPTKPRGACSNRFAPCFSRGTRPEWHAVEADETYIGGKRKNGTGRPMRGDRVDRRRSLASSNAKAAIVAMAAAGCQDSQPFMARFKAHVLPATYDLHRRT